MLKSPELINDRYACEVYNYTHTISLLVQAVLFWTLDGLWLCSLDPLLVYTTLAYPLAHSASSGHAVMQISWTHRTTERSRSPCKMGSFLSQCEIPGGVGSLQPGFPYTPWASPPGESGRPIPLLSPVSPGHYLFSSAPSLPHFLKSDLD